MGRLPGRARLIPLRGLTGVLVIGALAACGTASDTAAPISPSAQPAGDLAIVACPGSGALLALASPGQQMLITGRSADGSWLRVHVPGPIGNEGWAPADAFQVDGDPETLQAVRCGAELESDQRADGFRIVSNPDEPPTPLGPPPGDQLIQLVSFNKDNPPGPREAAPWWSSSAVPRVPHITQFDGGPLEGVNAVPAAGAMLARLGFGIVTTGSQLRALGSDQEGGTSLASFAEALADRGDVIFSEGYLASANLRELLSLGAGAVIVVDYGSIPEAERQQTDFVGLHAIYVDGFRPASSPDPAAYYVLDPMAISSQGYQGDWWPADLVDRAAMAFGERRIVALWAFAGGVNPTPAPSGAGPLDEAIGDEPSPQWPKNADRFLVESATGGLEIEPLLAVCLDPPTPAYCPTGLPATYDPPVGGLAASAPPPTAVGPLDLLYTDVPQPGVWRTILEAPAGSAPTFSYWPADGSGPVLRAVAAAATLGGKQVWMVTVPIPQAAGDFAFLASTVEAGVVNATEVGAISFGN